MVDLLDGASWRCVATDPDTVTEPGKLDDVEGRWLSATVPGTVASALRAVDGDPAARSAVVDDSDWWFVTELPGRRPHAGPWRLLSDGLATHCDIWVDDRLVASSVSMFVPVAVLLPDLPAGCSVALRFRSLTAELRMRRPRGRWRSTLVSAQGLRWIRTSLLGRAPVFSGVPAPVGPWRPLRILPGRAPRTRGVRVDTSVHGEVGVVRVSGAVTGCASATKVTVRIGEATVDAQLAQSDAGDREFAVVVEIPRVSPWWPHTHGDSPLYDLSIESGGRTLSSRRIGFRDIRIERGPAFNGFAVYVNGVEVFCRGAVWTPTDPIGLNDRDGTRRTLERVAEAGINMIRIPGTMVYETDEFWSDCAELGIMVWQDVMLATLDPPDDPEFENLLVGEVTHLLRRRGGNPALVVLSGGSETEQQPTMLGSVDRHVRAVHEILPALASAEAPGVAYVSSSPSVPADSSMLPTRLSSGVSHYFGVGAYRRPLGDVRQTRVRFAAECLAFAVPPSDRAVEKHFGSAAVAGHDPRWKAAVPRDRGSSWDFEDVRDHYVRSVFHEDPAEVRWSDPERYLDLGRAAICEAVGESFQFWRRPDSGCAGALVLALRDLEPGPGWGLLDWAGAPKAPWFVLRSLSRPVCVLVTDDGLDGLRIDVRNDTTGTVDGELRVRSHTRNGAVSLDVAEAVRIAPHDGLSWSLDALIGRFTDLSHAFRFGPQVHDSLTVTLLGPAGEVLDERVRLLGGSARPLERSVGLTATARQDRAGAWIVDVRTEALAQYVRLDVPGFDPVDSWFHLAAGSGRAVPLRPSEECSGEQPVRVVGRVGALNSLVSAPIVADTLLSQDVHRID
ncbi:glycosyl hydrolase [Rhodococcus sp. ABRD24]|nr:glycosyl hydrolase [Rhodococcus sp. ABRD24]QBJ98807.1 glycosyl hydrolase [Rhodococcus sp. ABRD24]